MRHDTAFIVGVLDKRDGKFQGASVFSEAFPTTHLAKFFQFVIVTGQGGSYEDGLVHLHQTLMQPEWRWLINLLDSSSVRTIDAAAKARA
jgi:hypothetical protein